MGEYQKLSLRRLAIEKENPANLPKLLNQKDKFGTKDKIKPQKGQIQDQKCPKK